jgi:hypothetical protein
MKILTLVLVLLLAVPPVQANGCAMSEGQGSSMASEMEHDCCGNDDPAPASDTDSCDGLMHCGACVTGPAAVPSATQNLVAWDVPFVSHCMTASLPPSHDSPPYRPPIS